MSDTQLSQTRQQLPDGWLSTTIGEISSPKQWPTISQDVLSKSGYPVFGANGLIGYYTQFTHEKPTVAVTCRGSTCGTIHVTLPFSYITGNAMALDGLNEELVDTRILAAILRFQGLRDCITGSAQPQIIGSDLRRVRISLPPKNEQRRIAEILDTLDDAIQKTEQLITKLKQIKQGLLNDLLTRGINENGQLRDPVAHPVQFNDSVLGRIPLSWEVAPIGTVGDVVTGATPPSSVPDAWGVLYPFVTPGEIHDGAISRAERGLSEKGLSFVRIIPAEATLVVCIGSTLGKTAQASEECATNQQINAVIPHEIYDASYVYHAISAHIYQLFRIAGLQAVPIVNKSQFSSLFIPVAPPEEQSRIAQIVKVQDDRIQAEFTCLRKLNTIKAGLMHDLLTGKVRVTSISGEQHV